MTPRKVRLVRETPAGEVECYLDPSGDHVLLTVEEYRDRIRDAFVDGSWHTRGWERSSTKHRLADEVGP